MSYMFYRQPYQIVLQKKIKEKGLNDKESIQNSWLCLHKCKSLEENLGIPHNQ